MRQANTGESLLFLKEVTVSMTDAVQNRLMSPSGSEIDFHHSEVHFHEVLC